MASSESELSRTSSESELSGASSESGLTRDSSKSELSGTSGDRELTNASSESRSSNASSDRAPGQNSGETHDATDDDRAAPDTTTLTVDDLSTAGLRRAVLVSARGPGGDTTTTRSRARRIADLLADRGCRVEWICPVEPGEEPSALVDLPDGVAVRRVESRAPDYYSVKERIHDAATELLLAQVLRREPAQVIHCLGFGAGNAATLPWVAARLGFPVILDVVPERTLCHRGDLIHADGSHCDDWLDPQRCYDCSRAACSRGPSPAQANGWWAWRWLGGWSPYPSLLEFHNRRDMITGCMRAALTVRVCDAEAGAKLQRNGVSAARIAVQDHDECGEELLALYLRDAPRVTARVRVAGGER